MCFTRGILPSIKQKHILFSPCTYFCIYCILHIQKDSSISMYYKLIAVITAIVYFHNTWGKSAVASLTRVQRTLEETSMQNRSGLVNAGHMTCLPGFQKLAPVICQMNDGMTKDDIMFQFNWCNAKTTTICKGSTLYVTIFSQDQCVVSFSSWSYGMVRSESRNNVRYGVLDANADYRMDITIRCNASGKPNVVECEKFQRGDATSIDIFLSSQNACGKATMTPTKPTTPTTTPIPTRTGVPTNGSNVSCLPGFQKLAPVIYNTTRKISGIVEHLSFQFNWCNAKTTTICNGSTSYVTMFARDQCVLSFSDWSYGMVRSETRNNVMYGVLDLKDDYRMNITIRCNASGKPNVIEYETFQSDDKNSINIVLSSQNACAKATVTPTKPTTPTTTPIPTRTGVPTNGSNVSCLPGFQKLAPLICQMNDGMKRDDVSFQFNWCNAKPTTICNGSTSYVTVFARDQCVVSFSDWSYGMVRSESRNNVRYGVLDANADFRLKILIQCNASGKPNVVECVKFHRGDATSFDIVLSSQNACAKATVTPTKPTTPTTTPIPTRTGVPTNGSNVSCLPGFQKLAPVICQMNDGMKRDDVSFQFNWCNAKPTTICNGSTSYVTVFARDQCVVSFSDWSYGMVRSETRNNVRYGVLDANADFRLKILIRCNASGKPNVVECVKFHRGDATSFDIVLSSQNACAKATMTPTKPTTPTTTPIPTRTGVPTNGSNVSCLPGFQKLAPVICQMNDGMKRDDVSFQFNWCNAKPTTICNGSTSYVTVFAQDQCVVSFSDWSYGMVRSESRNNVRYGVLDANADFRLKILIQCNASGKPNVVECVKFHRGDATSFDIVLSSQNACAKATVTPTKPTTPTTTPIPTRTGVPTNGSNVSCLPGFQKLAPVICQMNDGMKRDDVSFQFNWCNAKPTTICNGSTSYVTVFARDQCVVSFSDWSYGMVRSETRNNVRYGVLDANADFRLKILIRCNASGKPNVVECVKFHRGDATSFDIVLSSQNACAKATMTPTKPTTPTTTPIPTRTGVPTNGSNVSCLPGFQKLAPVIYNTTRNISGIVEHLSFQFNWCNAKTTTICNGSTSYVTMFARDQCMLSFSDWSYGMVRSESRNNVMYGVLDPKSGFRMNITIRCNASGKPNVVDYNNMDSSHRNSIDIVLSSQNACANATVTPTKPTTPTTTPIPTRTGVPTNGSNVSCLPGFQKLAPVIYNTTKKISGIVEHLSLQFNWCNAKTTTICNGSTSYVTMFARDQCVVSFSDWSYGMVRSESRNNVMYGVLDPTSGFRMNITIRCNASGKPNVVDYNNMNSSHKNSIDIVLSSQNACAKATVTPTKPTTPTTTPIPTRTMVPSIAPGVTCPPLLANLPSRVCVIRNVLLDVSSRFEFSWCKKVTGPLICGGALAYLSEIHKGTCIHKFQRWVGGVHTHHVTGTVTYSVGVSNADVLANVSVVCNRTAPNGTIRCPKFYNKTMDLTGTTTYTILLDSADVCRSGPPTTSPMPTRIISPTKKHSMVLIVSVVVGCLFAVGGTVFVVYRFKNRKLTPKFEPLPMLGFTNFEMTPRTELFKEN